jgi:hypothetical protein
VSVTATAPANAVSAVTTAYAATTAASGTQAYFDAALFEQSGSLNPYFDGSTAASGDVTYAWGGTSGASISVQSALSPTAWNVYGTSYARYQSTSAAYAGTYGLVIAPLGQGYLGTGTPLISITANLAYTLSAQVNRRSGTGTFVINIEWYNGSTYLTRTFSTLSNTTTGWQQFSVTGSAPATATAAVAVLAYFSYLPGADVIWADQVLLEQSNTLLPYIDTTQQTITLSYGATAAGALALTGTGSGTMKYTSTGAGALALLGTATGTKKQKFTGWGIPL